MTLAYDYAHLEQLLTTAARLVRDIIQRDTFPDALLMEGDAAALDSLAEITAERCGEIQVAKALADGKRLETKKESNK
jgi:hypothetical protein